MKKKELFEHIARFVGNSPLTVKNWQARQPKLYDLVSLGMFCKLNNLTEEEITKLMEIKELIKRKG